MSEKLSYGNGATENSENVYPSYEEVRQQEAATSIEDIKRLGQEYHTIEQDFAEKWPDTNQRFADDPEKRQSYKKFLIEKYESKIAYNRCLAENSAKVAGIKDTATLAEHERLQIRDVGHSIEVLSAALFADRYNKLRSRLAESPESAEELSLLEKTWGIVAEHTAYKHTITSRMDAFEAGQYDRSRTEAHNRMIDHLNAMNDLAEKHGEKSFTCRRFITSRGYARDRDLYGDLGARMKSDRMIVDEYFTAAYRNRIADLVRKIEHESRHY